MIALMSQQYCKSFFFFLLIYTTHYVLRTVSLGGGFMVDIVEDAEKEEAMKGNE